MTAPAQVEAGAQSETLTPMARGGALSLAGVVWAGLFSYALVFVLARGLGPREFGLFSVGVALFTILSNVGELGADTGLLRQVPRFLVQQRRNDLRSVLVVALVPVLVVGLLTSVAVWLWAPDIGALLVKDDAGRAGTYIRALAPFLGVGAAITVVLAALRGFGKLRLFVAVQNFAIPTARPPLVLAVLGLGAGTTALAIAWAAPLATGLVVCLVFLLRLVRRAETRGADDVSGRPTGEVASEFWRFSSVRGFAAAFAITQTWMNLFFVSALRSAREAGVYSGVIRYVIMGLFAFQAVRVAIGPQISTLLAQSRWADTEAVFQTATWWLIMLSWPYYLVLAVFAPTALGVFGSGFVAGSTALTILCLASLFNLGTGNVTLVLLMGGRSWWNLTNVGAALVTNVVLNLLLIPHYGIVGSAVAWAAAMVLENLLAVVQVGLFMHLHPFGEGYLSAALIAVGCYGVLGGLLRLVLGSTPTALALTMLAGTPAYGWLLWRRRELFRFDVLRSALQRRRAAPAAPVA